MMDPEGEHKPDSLQILADQLEQDLVKRATEVLATVHYYTPGAWIPQETLVQLGKPESGQGFFVVNGQTWHWHAPWITLKQSLAPGTILIGQQEDGYPQESYAFHYEPDYLPPRFSPNSAHPSLDCCFLEIARNRQVQVDQSHLLLKTTFSLARGEKLTRIKQLVATWPHFSNSYWAWEINLWPTLALGLQPKGVLPTDKEKHMQITLNSLTLEDVKQMVLNARNGHYLLEGIGVPNFSLREIKALIGA